MKKITKIMSFLLVAIILCSIPSTAYAVKICKKVGCDNRTVSGAAYCSEHKCSKYGCGSTKISGSEYCESHTEELEKPRCIDKSCNEAQYGDSKYCISHVCRQYGCNKRKSNDGGGYCYDHSPHFSKNKK